MAKSPGAATRNGIYATLFVSILTLYLCVVSPFISYLEDEGMAFNKIVETTGGVSNLSWIFRLRFLGINLWLYIVMVASVIVISRAIIRWWQKDA